MKQQRGFAFILVLALLTVGALMIVPILSYTGTALLSQRFAEGDLSERSGVEAALEDAIWQMLYGTALGEVNANGEYVYDFQLGLERFPVTIEIPTVPASEWVQQGPVKVKVEVVPNWLEAQGGVATLHYIIRLDMPQWDLTEFGFVLPQGLSYDVGSTFYKGPVREKDLDPDAAVDLTPPLPAPTRVWMSAPPQWEDMGVGDYTTVTLEDGRERITFRPTFVATGRRILIQTIQVTGTPPWGIHYVEPYFTTSGGTVYTGPTGALGVAMYNVIIEVEGQTVQAVIAFTPTGIVLVSYQVIE